MVSKIGVRDLKNKASEIIREVQEHDAEYIVTLRDEQDARRAQREDALNRLDALAEEITRSWRSRKGARQLLDEQRS